MNTNRIWYTDEYSEFREWLAGNELFCIDQVGDRKMEEVYKDFQHLKQRKEKMLKEVSSGSYKVWADDLDDFLYECMGMGLHVDTSHLDHDSCVTVNNKFCVEVVNDE